MTAAEAYNILLECIKDDKERRVQYRYTRKHPYKSKQIIKLINRRA